MTDSSRFPRVILPDDPERYRGLPPSEQRRLLEKKRRALEARGIRLPRFLEEASNNGSAPWSLLPLLDALLRFRACQKQG
jgi:hypothetical protein